MKFPKFKFRKRHRKILWKIVIGFIAFATIFFLLAPFATYF